MLSEITPKSVFFTSDADMIEFFQMYSPKHNSRRLYVEFFWEINCNIHIQFSPSITSDMFCLFMCSKVFLFYLKGIGAKPGSFSLGILAIGGRYSRFLLSDTPNSILYPSSFLILSNRSRQTFGMLYLPDSSNSSSISWGRFLHIEVHKYLQSLVFRKILFIDTFLFSYSRFTSSMKSWSSG